MESPSTTVPESSDEDDETHKADHDGQDGDDLHHPNYRSQPETQDESPPSLKNICKYRNAFIFVNLACLMFNLLYLYTYLKVQCRTVGP